MHELLDAAAQVLDRNWTGRYTTPATALYPHQWSWDSAFIAVGWRHLDPPRARRELLSLFEAQWRDGRVPQIVYDTSRDEEYQPNGAFWGTAQLPGAASVATAGLIQPPNHAWAVWLVHEADPEGSAQSGFLEALYPRLQAWHGYLADRRTSADSDLAAIVHPWESGTDNSPLWDEAIAPLPRVNSQIPRPDLLHADVSERPSQKEYGTYYWIAEEYRALECDHRRGPWRFLIEDPCFNALWAASEGALERIADNIGADPSPHRERGARIAAALESLYSPECGIYVARDVVADRLVHKATVNGLVPLVLAGSPRAADLLQTLYGPRFLGGGALMTPSYDTTAPDHDPAQYWRGPAWFNMNWLIVQGLRVHGQTEQASTLARHMRQLAQRHNFPEYVDPITGAPHGARRFSWTAALAIDLASSTAQAS